MMELDKNVFNDYLLKGEKVLKIFKPNKLKFWVARAFRHLPIFLVALALFSMREAILEEIWELGAALTEVRELAYGAGVPVSLIYILPALIVAAFFAIELVAGKLEYDRRVYCVTNKRAVIRCGIVGFNFRSFDLAQLQSSFAQITFFDRVVGQNTGRVKLLGGFADFTFTHVVNPRQVVRDIRELAEARSQDRQSAGNQDLANGIGSLVQNLKQVVRGWDNE